MLIVWVRHGRIDPADRTLLEKGDPHLDSQWVEANLAEIAKKVDCVKYDWCYTSGHHRTTEMMNQLRSMISCAAPVVYTRELNVASTSHDGKLYPADAKESYLGYYRATDMFYENLTNDDRHAVVLIVSSGIHLLSMSAMANGYEPTDEEEFKRWCESNAPKPGEVRMYYCNDATKEVREVRPWAC